MSELIFWGIVAVVLTVVITGWVAIKDSKQAGQSVLDSLKEVWTNIVIGFSINWVANLWVMPMAGFDITYNEAFLVGLVFTGISIVRSFVIRRWFNRIMVRKLHGNRT